MEGTKKADKKGSIKENSSAYMHYAGMATTMVVMLAIGALIGKKLDITLETEKPYWTLTFVVLALLLALYLNLKDLLAKK
jgi:hypothetical protein